MIKYFYLFLGTTSTVYYTPGNMLGYGSLLCWASNDIGRAMEPCVYKVVPVGKLCFKYSSISMSKFENLFYRKIRDSFLLTPLFSSVIFIGTVFHIFL